MRPMAVTLNREGDIESVAQYVASLEQTFPESTLHGNAGAGAALYETGCAQSRMPAGASSQVRIADSWLRACRTRA